MKLSISSVLMDEIQAAAGSASPREICGLLLGEDQKVQAIQLAANVATDPRRHFEIDPATLIAAEKVERSGGMPIIGYFHSHPAGDVRPSVTDADSAAADDRIWLIVNGQDAAAWRATRNGHLLNRFDAVELDCTLD